MVKNQQDGLVFIFKVLQNARMLSALQALLLWLVDYDSDEEDNGGGGKVRARVCMCPMHVCFSSLLWHVLLGLLMHVFCCEHCRRS